MVTDKERVIRYKRRIQLMEDLVGLDRIITYLNTEYKVTSMVHCRILQENLRRVRDGEAPSPKFLKWSPDYIREMFEDAKNLARRT